MIVCKRSLYSLHVALLTNLMYVTFVIDINVRYILNFIFIWIFYFNMINSKLKKNVLVIRGSGTLGDPLLLFGEGMWILSSNSDGDGEGTGTYAKYRGWVRGDWSPPLPSSLPSLVTKSQHKQTFFQVAIS